VTDEQTLTALRRATEVAVRDHHLDPGVTATAWSAAHPPSRRFGHRWAFAAGVTGAVAVATALTVWGSSKHANPPAGGLACARNVSTAALPSWARAGFAPAGLHTPHVVSQHGQIIGVLFVTLRVHQPAGTHNKILWIAKRGYGPLHIRAQLEGTSRTVTRDLPNGPGPSYVNVPAPGCWTMQLTWSGYHDTIAFRYAP
jgi:hypothetical protein